MVKKENACHSFPKFTHSNSYFFQNGQKQTKLCSLKSNRNEQMLALSYVNYVFIVQIIVH